LLLVAAALAAGRFHQAPSTPRFLVLSSGFFD